MSTATTDRFARYANDADESIERELADEGLDSAFVQWLRESPARASLFDDAQAMLAHRMLMAEKDDDQLTAAALFRSQVRGWIGDYVNSWGDKRRAEFMAEIDEETRVARELDLEEGNDD